MLYKSYIKPYHKILTTLALAYFLFIVGLYFFSVFAIKNIRQLSNQTSVLYEHSFNVYADALEFQSIVRQVQNGNLEALLLSRDKGFKYERQNVEALLGDRLSKIEGAYLGEKSKVQDVREATTQWKNNELLFDRLMEVRQYNEAHIWLADYLTVSFEELDQKATYIIKDSEKAADAVFKDAQQMEADFHKQLIQKIIFLFIFVTAVLGIAAVFLIKLLHSKDQEVEQNQNQLRVLASSFNLQEGIIICDENGLIIKTNQAFSNITGYSAEEALGRNPRFLSSGRHDASFYTEMWKSLLANGKWDGEVWNRRKTGEIYPENLAIVIIKDSEGKTINYVASMTDITKRVADSEEIKQLAFFDSLTGLPNRRLLLDRLAQTLHSNERTGNHGALLFLDLDNFKAINDSYGHDSGDLLLQQAAVRIVDSVRAIDTVSRIGGDEFVVILQSLNQQESEAVIEAEIIAKRILYSLNVPYKIKGRDDLCSTSIGATIFQSNADSIDVLKQADIALYKAKESGRNVLFFFDPIMQTIINAQAEIKRDLKEALLQHQFELYYQVQVDVNGAPVGAEALLRWLHPTKGYISPADFIPIAEESQAIISIGDWVIDAACAQLKQWESNELTHTLSLSVNISAKEFRAENFVEKLKMTIRHHAINPSKLRFELTEGMLISDINDAIETMNKLNELGIYFELDDFGTGYSSLQYLKRLPVYQLKIDRTFVRDVAESVNEQGIVRAIIAMAEALQIRVLAEGVETKAQRQHLADIGCNYFQGYLFGKPVPIDQFEAALH
jgi:diguanylate cyclase (GGDEF)-like protein/PAS domain S-box-containing protein